MTGTYAHFSDQGAGDIDYVDCEQAAGTVNECDHELRFVNINVPGRKDMTIDEYQLKFVAGSATARRSSIGFPTRTSSAVSSPTWMAARIRRRNGLPSASRRRGSLGDFYYPIWDESWETKHSTYETTTHELQFKSTGDIEAAIRPGLYYLHEKKQIRYDMEMLNVKTWYEDAPCRSASIRTACPTAGSSTRPSGPRRPRRLLHSSIIGSWRKST